MRVLVTGSRDWDDWRAIYAALINVCEEFDLNHTPDEYGNTMPDPRKITVVHGDCPDGADHWADEWCISNFLTPEKHPANWKALKKRAGYVRNEAMANTYPDLVLAFWKGRSNGTGHMITLAEDRDIPVRIWCRD